MTDDTYSEDIYIDISAEVDALQNLFPTISRAEFYHVETGTVGAKLQYIPTSGSIDTFDVLLEYPRSYPNVSPRMWVTDPPIDPDSRMVVRFDDRGHALVDYLDDDDWHRSMNGFHAATMMKSWIASYCQWVDGDDHSGDSLEPLVAELSSAVKHYRQR